MRKNNVELLIFIKGNKSAIEYKSPRDLQTYIEGREGSDFEIEVVNHNRFRVEAVVSVDGLSVLDGKTAGTESGGYLIEAHGRVRIPGWVVDRGTAAKFFFSGRKGGSYVEQSTGQPTNKGVIGLMVFEERGRNTDWGTVTFGGNLRGGGSPRTKGIVRKSARSNTVGAWSSGNDAFLMGSRSIAQSYSGNASTFASQACLSASNAATSANDQAVSANAIAQAAVEQTLGTGFGEAVDFTTTKVKFNRGDMLVLMALFYDDKRGLQKRGIEMVRPSQKRYETTPNPFPNLEDEGCTPPSGWRR